jgi:hypothetical protein
LDKELDNFAEILQISASWYDYDNTVSYTITASILKNGVVVGGKDTDTGTYSLHACATESVKY